MKPGTPFFVGERLKEAREARGLSVAALADLVDMRRETIYQLESGKITPGPALYEQLQKVLRMPAAFFYEPVDPAQVGQVLFRSLRSATKPARQRARRRLEWLERVALFAQSYVDIPAFDVPDYGFPDDPTRISDDDIDDAAEDLRDRWKLGLGPISNMIWLMENHGMVLSREDLAAVDLDAAFMRRDQNVFVLLGADKGTAVRSRMDAAHELGHVVVHGRCSPPASEKDPLHKVMEGQAFRFASTFLLPAESFSQDVWMASLDEFLALKPKWKVAIAAMIMRCHRLGIVSDEQSSRLWAQYSGGRRRWKRAEPFDSEWQPEQPLLLRRSIELILKERVASVDELLNEIRLPATDIEDLAGLPRGTISEGAIPISFRERVGGGEPQKDNVLPFDRPAQRHSAIDDRIHEG